MSVVDSFINSVASLGQSPSRDNDFSASSDNGKAGDFDQEMSKALKRVKNKARTVMASVLNNKGLSVSGNQESAFSFMNGARKAGQVAEDLDFSRASLPSSYKKQLGLGLMALGRQGSSGNSMQSGAALMNCRSSAEALHGVFASLGAERSFLKLDKNALPALGQVLSDSGLDDESLNNIMSELAAGSLTLDQIFYKLEKLNLGSGGQDGQGLTATSDGLSALGQFFGSLGASAEIVEAVTSGFTPGEKITASSLRQIIGSGDDGFLAPCLSEADTDNLMGMLRSMGFGQKNLNSLSNLLSQSNGQMSMNSFLDFLENVEQSAPRTASGQELDLVKTIMANISREQELAKTPVFNETLAKLQALGDREIDDEFVRSSPALQALRGGITAANLSASLGGQNNQGGQNQRQSDRESREQQRQALSAAVNNESSPAATLETVETLQSYGGQESLARQISQKILYSQRRGIHRLKMSLNPADLGQLDIELKVKDDQLVAHIRAKSREAFEALAGEIESLKETLAENGLEINNLTLAYDDTESGRSEFADLREFKARHRGGQDTEINPAAAEAARKSTRQGELSRII